MHPTFAVLGLDLVAALQLCIAVAAVLALVFHRLKQPALLAYIITGLVLGLLWRPLVGASMPGLEKISHLGLTLLLFIIGLELDLKGIFRLGPRAAAAVLLQAPLAIAAVLGLQWLAAALGLVVPGLGQASGSWFYFAVAAALSSTAVVVKLLADRFDLDSAAGRLTVLTLIAQDIWAVLALSYVSSGGGGGLMMLLKLGGAAVVTVLIVVVARTVVSRVLTSVARSPDLLAMAALAWCFVGTSALSAVGLSAEMGALVAGLSLSVLPMATEILAKMVSLRDFFMAIFFVTLGMSLPAPTLGVIGSAAALAGLVVLVRVALFTPTLLLAGQGPIVSFAAPINLAQLSEFSLLLVAVGMSKGALGREEGSIISYAMMLSVLVASYAIKFNYPIAQALAHVFHVGQAALTRAPDSTPEAAGPGHGGAPIVLLGYYRNADALVRRIAAESPELLPKVLVIDFNLKQHAAIQARGVRVAYGDISNPETLRHHGVAEAAVVLSTLGDTFLRGIRNLQLVQQVRSMNPRAFIVATAETPEQVDELKAAGANVCVNPPDDAAPRYLEQVEHGLLVHERSEE
jgi:Kef-type K+ transport system membrane component KefB